MPRIADRIATARGWPRRGIALAAGAVGALILAPLNLGVALIVPMVVAVWLLDGLAARSTPSRRAAFADGWWLGFGYHLAGFWWLGAAFLVDPQFTALLPLGVVGVPAVLALFNAAGFLLAHLLWRPGAMRVVALATGVGAAEWARGHWFSGFPWNTFGMALGGRLVPAQLASLVGLDGLTLVAVALAAAPATLADRHSRRWFPMFVAVGCLAAILAFGLIRLSRTPPSTVAGVVIRLVQPGLRPDEKFSYENKDAIVDSYLSLSRRYDADRKIGLAEVTTLIWPESPFPFILTRERAELDRIAAILPPGTTLVTGAAREEDVAEPGRSPRSDYFNAVVVIGHDGRILDRYDKVHLVPFGEYLPFDGFLRRIGLRNFVAIPGGFTAGRDRRSLAVPSLPPALPLICYEAIFPTATLVQRPRPRYLLNITNDGWFGLTTGPWQHFAQARLRTIEEGLPMVRGAATGVSAFIDAYGRIEGLLPLGDVGVLDGPLPGSLPPPPYTRAPRIAAISIGLSVLILGVYRRRRKPMP